MFLPFIHFDNMKIDTIILASWLIIISGDLPRLINKNWKDEVHFEPFLHQDQLIFPGLEIF